MALCIMLVGTPGSGKSSWAEKHSKFFHDQANQIMPILSTDGIFEEYALEDRITYSEAFVKYPYASVEDEFYRRMKRLTDIDASFIWDQTNLSVKARRAKLQKLPRTYKVAAVAFDVDDDVVDARLEQRVGKTIPRKVIENMRASYEVPTVKEGFDLVYVNPDEHTAAFSLLGPALSQS